MSESLGIVNWYMLFLNMHN